jgi:glutathione synthase/RimK-type ligase-like ATP-grasp enzyme
MTKDKILSFIPEPFALKVYTLDKKTDLSSLKYPLIFKPVICNGNGKGVQKINDEKEAKKYMKNTKEQHIIAQEYYPGKYEVGVLYERYPLNDKGKIISVVSKVTDKDWKPLRCNTCSFKGGVDCQVLKATPELERKIDEISKSIPDFYVGRYDIRFENLDDFLSGTNFKVIEVNGVMGFDLITSIDSNSSMFTTVWNLLFWIGRRVLIGFQNILMLRGGNILSALDIGSKIDTYEKCCDYEHLFQPSST